MQIVTLELSHFNFYCPATGEPILIEDEPVNKDAKSLQAYWVDEIMEEPFFKNKEFEKDWNKFAKKCTKDKGFKPDFDDLRRFLTEYNQPSWVVFELTTSGMACGPVSTTVWKVINMDTTLY